MAFTLPAALIAGEETGTRAFDLPAGDAARLLKLFSQQSGRGVIAGDAAVSGVKTNAVKGEMTARAAVDRMLARTGLVATLDEKTGAFAVRKEPDGQEKKYEKKAQATPDDAARDSQKKNMTKTPPTQAPMKQNKLLNALAATLALLIAPAEAQTTSPATGSAAQAEDQTIELSPFVISADSDAGWVASSSLAGSRMNTPLRDTGASISVLTSEFLADLGAVDIADAVEYSVNINMDDAIANQTSENFLQETFDVGRMSVRGLRATSTRNYYRWRLQSDAYNIDRIEENRGPNSILFGIGSAGGVINSMTKRATFGREFRKATIMFGSFDSYRGTVDVNQNLLDDKLALRINAVHSHMGSHRHHAFNETSRLHLASTFKLRPQTRFRLDFEIGDIDQVTTRAAGGQDGLTRWIAAGSPTFDEFQAANAALGISRYGGASATNPNANTRFTYYANLGQAFDVRGTNRSTGTGNVVLDEQLLDQSVNPSGPGQKRTGELKNLTLFWEEQFGDNTFMELSHNRQWGDSNATITGQARSENVHLYADPNTILPNGEPNPFAGQMYFEGGRLNQIRVDERNHASRLMLSHEQDFGKWGDYRLATMGEYEWRNQAKGVMVEVWEGAPFSSAPENVLNHVYRRHYVTPGDWSTYYVSGSGDGGLLTGIPHPTEPGRTLNSTFVPFNAGQRSPIERQRTLLIGGQARYFNDRLVLAGGFRRDLLSIKNANAIRDPDTNLWTTSHPDVDWFYQNFAGSTRTAGVVGHVTKNISLFYNTSNSLNLPRTGHRILPDSGPPPLSNAKGRDFGAMLTVFDGKFVARANAFEVELVNATGGGFGGTFSNPTVLNNNVMDALVGAGLVSQAEADAREINSNQAIKNQRLEGYEFNMTGRLTQNWQLTVNYSYTDGYDSEIGPEIKAWAETAIPYYLQYPDVMTDVAGGATGFMTVRERVELWQRNAGTEFLREGLVLLGNRKHKFNFFTRYTFNEGPLNGMFVGGGYRYQSKMPTNFSSAVLQFSKSRGEADLLMGYRLPKMRFLPHGARIQLNIRNLFDETEPHIARYAPNDATIISRAALVAPRTWRITTSFEF